MTDYEEKRKQLEALKSTDSTAYQEELSNSWDGMQADLEIMGEVVAEHAKKTGKKFSLYKNLHIPDNEKDQGSIEWSDEFMILMRRFLECYGEAEGSYRLEKTIGYFSCQVKKTYN